MTPSTQSRLRHPAAYSFLFLIILLLAACQPQENVARADLPVIPTPGPPTFIAPSPTPEATPAIDPAQADCENGSRYLSDVTIPDGSPMASGQSTVKTWHMLNNGTCNWGSGYQLVQVSGNVLVAGGPVPVPDVPAGEEADISVTVQLSFEAALGSEQRATFQMRDPQGEMFGARVFVLVLTTTQADLSKAIVSGKVWLDHCPSSSTAPSVECVASDIGGLIANGILDSGETGIAGVTVRVSAGNCPGSVVDFRTIKTDANGNYTLIGVEPGTACVSIDALTPDNESILIPGRWTSPASGDGVASVSITLAESERRSGVNFGWDFQFD